MNIDRSINIACAKADIKRTDVAKIIGVDHSVLSRIGKQKFLNIETLNEISAVFNMSVSEFIALGEEEKINAVKVLDKQ